MSEREAWSHTFDAAIALGESALAQFRAANAISEARVSQLKAVAALEAAGDEEGARRLLDEVRQ